jgi:hypothetical protein
MKFADDVVHHFDVLANGLLADAILRGELLCVLVFEVRVLAVGTRGAAALLRALRELLSGCGLVFTEGGFWSEKK